MVDYKPAKSPEIEKTIVARDNAGNILEIILYNEVILLDNGSLGLKYFPDEAVTFIRHKPNFRMLVTASSYTMLLEGKDIQNITSAKRVLGPGNKNSIDNGYAGISGSCYQGNGILYALYHCEDQEEMEMIEGGIPGFYASIGAAISKDNGMTWDKLGPVITSSKPKEWKFYDTQNARGAGNPAMLPEKNGNYVYVYYTELSCRDGRGVRICMARADISKKTGLPDVWKKYNNGSFDEPGLGGEDTPVINTSEWEYSATIFPFATYSRELDRYIMFFNINNPNECTGRSELRISGIYVVFSDDGIQWSYPQALIIDYSIPLIGKSFSGYPTLIWDENSGTEGWLVYCHSPRWGHEFNQSGTPHYLVGRRFKLNTKVTQPDPNLRKEIPDNLQTSNLLGYWKFDEGKGTVIEDHSGNNHWGNLKGTPKWIQDEDGYGLALDPSNGFDYVELLNSLSLDTIQEGNYTIYARFKPLSVPVKINSSQNPTFGIFMKEGWHIGLSYSQEKKFVMNHFLEDGTWVGSVTSKVFEPDHYYHVAGVINKTKGETAIYVDGVLMGSGRFTPGLNVRSLGRNPWRIGIGSPNNKEYPFPAHGIIDIVQLYNVALTDKQIRSLVE